jgi:hypothetical protein
VGSESLKCLSLWQPWATLVAIGAKSVETRSWSTPYRGMIAIHAAKRWNAELRQISRLPPFVKAMTAAGLPIVESPEDCLPFGAVLALCFLTDIVPTDGPVPDWMTAGEMPFGDYSAGRYAWKLADIRPLKEPLPLRGVRGLVDLDSNVAAQIMRRTRP